MTKWNYLGNSLSYLDFGFPIFLLQDESESEVIKQKYNTPQNGSGPEYPLCAMQLSSHMHAVTSTVTCMRRSLIQSTFSLNPATLFSGTWPPGQRAPWLPLSPSSLQLKPSIKSPMFSRCPKTSCSPSSRGTLSGFLSPPQETFDYIGSSRMVYDMQNGRFPVKLENIDSFLELSQVRRGCFVSLPGCFWGIGFD
ncbi:Nicastrin, partial [Ophiophagus hannah]